MDKLWILVGMMGSGKSTIGRELARVTGREYIDADKTMSNTLGRSVTSVFRVYGEDAFRDHETALLRSLQPHFGVLATGGGIVMREANWVEMRRLGVTAFIDVEIGCLLARLERGRDRRPLLHADDWESRVQSLLEARRPLYERADVVVHLAGEDVSIATERVRVALEGLS